MVNEPSAAELARTVMAAAASLTVTVGQRRAHLSGAHTVEQAGQLLLELPGDSALLAAVLAMPTLGVPGRPEAPALIELTDVAPVAMRQRVRARLTISGWLTPAEPERADPAPQSAAGGATLRFEPVAARLVDGLGCRVTDLDDEELAAAQPDPLADTEAELLGHLAHSHADAIEHLVRLVPPRQRYGLRAVVPQRLDRYGIVLRLEYARRDRDARLPFPSPAPTAADVPGRLHELLTAARYCHPRSGRPSALAGE